MRHGGATEPGAIHGFTPEDIERGYRPQPYRGVGMFGPGGDYTMTKESVPVPVEVTTLYELRQLRLAIDRMGRRLFREWDE